jgi:hypothetical protein
MEDIEANADMSTPFQLSNDSKTTNTTAVFKLKTVV